MALTTNLVAYWKLDESSGSRSDSGPSGYTLTGVGTVGSASGKINNGANFTGSTQGLQRANPTNLHFTSDFSISFWINLNTQVGTNAYYILGGTDDVTRTYYFGYRDNAGTKELGLFISDGTNSSVWVTQTLNTATWYHLVLVYSASAGSMQWYVNNVALTLKTGLRTSINSSTQTYTLGNANGLAQALIGVIDEYGAWSRTLNSTEVSQLYNSGNGLTYPFTSSSTSINNTMGLLGIGM